LDEHHDGGDAGAGDFGGVVEKAGREAMRLRAGLRDGFIAEGDDLSLSMVGSTPSYQFPPVGLTFACSADRT
jgi:hypothetical protein